MLKPATSEQAEGHMWMSVGSHNGCCSQMVDQDPNPPLIIKYLVTFVCVGPSSAPGPNSPFHDPSRIYCLSSTSKPTSQALTWASSPATTSLPDLGNGGMIWSESRCDAAACQGGMSNGGFQKGLQSTSHSHSPEDLSPVGTCWIPLL